MVSTSLNIKLFCRSLAARVKIIQYNEKFILIRTILSVTKIKFVGHQHHGSKKSWTCSLSHGLITIFDYVLILLIFRVCHTTESKSDFGLLLAANR